MHRPFQLLTALTVVLSSRGARAQPPDTTLSAPVARAVHGVVTSRGTPLTGVNVFDLETLEGVVTGPDGAFRIAVTDTMRRVIRLTARRIGYKPQEVTVHNVGDGVVIPLEAQTALASVSVLAGRFTANAERTAALTPLEVMTTPGGGDVNSAVKTLPGVQNVDEGTGLFVRGGDFTETRMFIEGAPMFTAYQFEAPTGSVAGTINPFLTDGITFSSGGFGAQWGNALSGIVDLQSQGLPQSTFVNVNATLLSVGAGGAARVTPHLGFTATAGFSDLSTLFALNGNPRAYRPPPRGSTFSAQGVWDYSKTGRLKLFALRQRSDFGIAIDDPAAQTTYTTSRTSDVMVLSLRDTIGKLRPFVNASTSGLVRGDTNGAYASRTLLRSVQLHAEAAYVWSDRVTTVFGGEVERIGASYNTQFPRFGYNPGVGAPSSHTFLRRAAVRDAAFVSLDTRPLSSVELITGLRTDRSGFTTARTLDPRVSVAWVPHDSLTFTASWGVYHQVADPAFLDQSPPGINLPALRAEMSIVGVQLGDGLRFARFELWRKDYIDLVALTRDYAAVAGLSGRATGADFFARRPGPLGTRLRFTWSAARSRRTDPNTLRDARAPFDITNSITAVVEKDWTNGWHVGASQRFATGRPFTDVIGATYDASTGVFVPKFGPPLAASLPDYRRADLAISRATLLSSRMFLVVFGAINNVFNTTNQYGYTWTRDYAERIPVRSAINRTLFIGANLVLSKQP
jgi:vitamin B12 transporter